MAHLYDGIETSRDRLLAHIADADDLTFLVGWGNIGDEELVKRFEQANREHLAGMILACRDCFAQAIAEIREALEAEGA